MDMQISGRHLSVGADLRAYAEEKLDHLGKYSDRIHRVRVTLARDAGDCDVEIIASVRRGKPVVAEARADGFHKAMDLAFDKAGRQLQRLKERTKEHRRHARAEETPETAEAEGGPDEEPEDEDYES